MQCSFILKQLDPCLDGELTKEDLDVIEQHLETCTSCRAEYSFARNILSQCHNQTVPEPRPGYERRALEFLAREHREKTGFIPLGFAAGFGSAIAALLIVWFVVFNFTGSPDDNMPVLTVEIPAMQSRKVELVFNSPRHIQKASLSIELPDGTEIVGYPGQRKLVWRTTLKQGSNRLSLPIMIKNKKGGILLATISHQGQTRTFKLNLISIPASSEALPVSSS